MLKNWMRIEPHVKAASEADGADIKLPPSTGHFKKAVERTTLCFNDIHATAVVMQKRNKKLTRDCRDLQEQLLNEVNTAQDDINHHWANTSFGSTYIPSDSAKRPNQNNFLNAVCKYQKREVANITTSEKRGAVKKWVGKKKGGNAEAPNSPLKTLAEQMKKSAKGSSKK